jgi:hypothetical protein
VKPEVAVEWIESICDEMTVSEACAWLGIARATYYRWKVNMKVDPQKVLWRRLDSFVSSINIDMVTVKSLHSFKQSSLSITNVCKELCNKKD